METVAGGDDNNVSKLTVAGTAPDYRSPPAGGLDHRIPCYDTLRIGVSHQQSITKVGHCQELTSILPNISVFIM